jgi:hypothetical protein
MPRWASSTNSCSGYKGSVGSPCHASTLQATDQETDPSSHQHRRTPHHRHHSLHHNLTKLIARDKAVSTFWILLANHLKEKVIDMQFGCSKRDGFRLVLYTNNGFSCRYSMSYDISIFLLKKNFYKTIFSKSSREGGTHLFSMNNDGQSNMTIPFPWQYPTSTRNHHRSTAVPYEYSVRHLFSFSFRKHFYKPKLDIGLSNGRPNRPWSRTRLFE